MKKIILKKIILKKIIKMLKKAYYKFYFWCGVYYYRIRISLHSNFPIKRAN